MKLEADYEKEMIELQKINNVTITWVTSRNEIRGVFKLPEMDGEFLQNIDKTRYNLFSLTVRGTFEMLQLFSF